jgi:hypothetical protein
MDGPRFGAWDATQQLRRVKVFGLIYSWSRRMQRFWMKLCDRSMHETTPGMSNLMLGALNYRINHLPSNHADNY